VDKAIATWGKDLDFYNGTKEEFLRDSFARPETIEKTKLLAGRTFNELDGVTADMSLRMSRALTDGLVQGKNPLAIARDLDSVADLGAARSRTIARTEIIRAHAEGQLDAFSALGVEDLGVSVEWSTAGDDRVCPRCVPLEGIVVKIDEAKGMLPRHPNCRCAWIPAGVGESPADQKRTQKAVSRAVVKSQKLSTGDDGPSWGPARPIAKERTAPIVSPSRS
jgi:SPP1 gp7 family putative phage head morphogenesis protein